MDAEDGLDAHGTHAGARQREDASPLAWLDALRGIAILAVVIVHASALIEPTGRLRDIAMTGQRGVQLFYVLSAFTIFLSLDRRRARGERSLVPFFVRRFCRIAPLFYVAIAANLLLSAAGVAVSASPPSMVDLPLALLFLHGLTPTAINSIAVGGWSIAVEAMFYMVAPLLYQRARRLLPTTLSYLCLSIVCTAISWLFWSRATDSVTGEYFSFLWFPVELPVFLIGILTYLWWKQSVSGLTGLTATLGAGSRKRVSLTLLALSALLLFESLPTSNMTMEIAATAFAPLLIGLSIHPWSLLVNRATRSLGRISFSIYLMHFFCLGPARHILRQLDQAGLPVMHVTIGIPIASVVMLALAIPLSSLTHRWIELPGIEFGNRLIQQFKSSGWRLPSFQRLSNL